jgi:hypothetical protein
LRLRSQTPSAEIEVQVRNGTGSQVTVQSIRMLDAPEPVPALDGPASADRILSDSFSEDRPNMKIHDLAQTTDGMHRAVGSQLIYNRQSRQSLFVGALTSEKWLTVLRLRVDKDKKDTITSYEVDSTGTTELAKQNSLQQSPPEDQIELSLPVEPAFPLTTTRNWNRMGKRFAIAIRPESARLLPSAGGAGLPFTSGLPKVRRSPTRNSWLLT